MAGPRMEPSLALLAYLIFHSSFQPLFILLLTYKFHLRLLLVPLERQQRLQGNRLPYPLPLSFEIRLPVLVTDLFPIAQKSLQVFTFLF